MNAIAAKSSIRAPRLRLARDLSRNRGLYLMVLPVLLYYFLFHYAPMYGAVIAFKEFSPARGILQSSWATPWYKHFLDFFGSFYFLRVLSNTVFISINSLLFSFPAPILLALLLNELRVRWFSRTVQTLTYMPHFVSLVVFCGLVREFTMDSGFINQILSIFGWKPVTMLSRPEIFVPVYVISDIWKEVGWGSIIYLAALMSIDPQLYEAARIDGASRLAQTWHVTLPGIASTVVILLILRLGHIMNVGFEKIILLYNPAIYSSADVISSFVYRKGLLEFNWSYSAAVGLFNSVINFSFLVSANWVSRKLKNSSLW
jgi:putative aldouronate transport system permease protein